MSLLTLANAIFEFHAAAKQEVQSNEPEGVPYVESGMAFASIMTLISDVHSELVMQVTEAMCPLVPHDLATRCLRRTNIMAAGEKAGPLQSRHKH